MRTRHGRSPPKSTPEPTFGTGGRERHCLWVSNAPVACQGFCEAQVAGRSWPVRSARQGGHPNIRQLTQALIPFIAAPVHAIAVEPDLAPVLAVVAPRWIVLIVVVRGVVHGGIRELQSDGGG